MVPHYSGTTLDAQARYAAGTRRILENYLHGEPQDPQNVIVGVGTLPSSSPFFFSLLTIFPAPGTAWVGKYETKACKFWVSYSCLSC